MSETHEPPIPPSGAEPPVTDAPGGQASVTDPAGTAATPAASAAAVTTRPPTSFASFDAATRLVIGAGAASLVLVLVGVVLGAWSLGPFAAVMLVLAVAAVGAAWVAETMTVGASTRPWLPVVLVGAGAASVALAGLAVVEMLGDLDDMDDYGGILGLVVGILLLGSSGALLVGAVRRVGADGLRPSSRGAQLAVTGAGLVLIAWVLHLTIGFWAFGPATWSILAIVAAMVLIVAADEDGIPSWAAWVGVGLGVFAAWTAVGQWGALMDVGSDRVELGLEDYLPFLAYVIGIVLVIAGGVLSATGGRLAMPSTSGGSPPASAG